MTSFEQKMATIYLRVGGRYKIRNEQACLAKHLPTEVEIVEFNDDTDTPYIDENGVGYYPDGTFEGLNPDWDLVQEIV